MPETPVTFQSENQQVVGMLHLPDRPGDSFPIVLFCHGFTGSKPETHRHAVQTARLLAAQGVASFRFDFRGAGDSEGTFQDMSISSQLADARAALVWLDEHPAVDTTRLGLSAMSMGGLIGATLVGEEDRFGAVVLQCPVGDGPGALGRKGGDAVKQSLEKHGYFDMEGWKVGPGFVEEVVQSQPIEALAGSQAPILILHGDQDETVPVEDAYAYREAIESSGGQVTLQIIEGAGHTFDSVPWIEEVVAATSEWLLKHL